MKFIQILTRLYSQPWLILPAVHAQICSLVEARAMGEAQREDGEDICGNKIEVDQMTVEDGTAIIPVGGVIASKLSKWERGAGAVDTRDIANDLDAAMGDDQVERVLFDVDSPGGTVGGTITLADRIAGYRGEKPMAAYTDGLMASAAYWISSGVDRIFATGDAEVGSVGVYLPILDQSVAFEQRGLAMDVIKAGKYKAMGLPGTSLTGEQRAYLQAGIDDLHAQFKSHISTFRGVTDRAMEGQTFMGSEGLDVGMVDEIVGGRSEAINAMCG